MDCILLRWCNTLCILKVQEFTIRIVNTRRNIALLGSTGSIGQHALEVVRHLSPRFRVTYLTTNRNLDLLRRQIEEFRPRGVLVRDPSRAALLRDLLGSETEILSGEEGLEEIVTRSDVDLVLSSLVGFAGLKPTLRAIEAGKDVALANKETLVVGGQLIMEKVRATGVRLIPIDSEHSAILQCLQGEDLGSVSRLILTASGGPFLHTNRERFRTITRAEALSHPTWKMGSKVTIDSATLMNKGLEVMEAHWLFGIPPSKIEVVIHPQSIIHSMVEFVDGSIKAQMGIPDMKIPIQYALTYPERPPTPFRRLDFAVLREMTFFAPDLEKFRCLALAFNALKAGGTVPAVLSAANEAAVEFFLEERIPFSAIPELIEEALASHTSIQQPTLEDLVHADHEGRTYVRQNATSYAQ
jgi:1-deoxy-D-xylulose-5-phosphate reductoisomerase